jgi:hypothetical protein
MFASILFRWLMVGLSVWSLVWLAFGVDGIINSTNYRWGTEVAGWSYRSQWHYLFSSALPMLLAISVWLLNYRLSDFQTVTVGVFAALLLVATMSFVI